VLRMKLNEYIHNEAMGSAEWYMLLAIFMAFWMLMFMRFWNKVGV